MKITSVQKILSEVKSRYDRIDQQIRSGKLSSGTAIHRYAYATKDGLGIANLNAAQLGDVGKYAKDEIPFIVTTLSVDRDGDVVIPRGCQLDGYRDNAVIFFGHQEWPVPIATSWPRNATVAAPGRTAGKVTPDSTCRVRARLG